MSDGLKIGLVLAGVGLVGFLFYEHEKAAASGVPSIPNGTLGVAPGTTTAATTAGRSTLGTIGHYTALAAVAPIIYPTKAVVSGAKAVYGAVSSIF